MLHGDSVPYERNHLVNVPVYETPQPIKEFFTYKQIFGER